MNQAIHIFLALLCFNFILAQDCQRYINDVYQLQSENMNFFKENFACNFNLEKCKQEQDSKINSCQPKEEIVISPRILVQPFEIIKTGLVTFYKSDKYFDFDTASEFCHSHGFNLAVPMTSLENDLLLQYVLNLGDTRPGKGWIGLKRTVNGGLLDFRNVNTGKIYSRDEFLKLFKKFCFPEQPLNWGGKEPCMHIWTKDNNQGTMWNDCPCSEKQPAICEKRQ